MVGAVLESWLLLRRLLLEDAADVLVVVDMSSLSLRRRRSEGKSEFDRLTSDDDAVVVVDVFATVVDCDDFMGLSPSASRFADRIRSGPSFVVVVGFTSSSSFFAFAVVVVVVGCLLDFWLLFGVDFSSFKLDFFIGLILG